MLLAGLFAAAFAVSAVLRLRTEETASRADPVLSGSVGRVRRGFSQVLVAVAGSAVLLAVAGIGTGLGYGLCVSQRVSVGDEVARMFGAGMAELPPALVIGAIAAAAFGLLPDVCVAVAWSVLGLAVLVNLFGQSLQLSGWTQRRSTDTREIPRSRLGWRYVMSQTGNIQA
jgi:ABC-2 type transport system permease protein